MRCIECDGTGAVDSGGVLPWGAPIDVKCSWCNGTGEYVEPACGCSPFGHEPTCNVNDVEITITENK